MLKPETAHRKDLTQPTAPAMTHRHFAEIARIIRTLPDTDDTRAGVAQRFADELEAAYNKRPHGRYVFDRFRFIKACLEG